MATRTDEEILALIEQGNESAFTEFYERHGARLLGLANAILKNQREAEDVLQECFLHFWNKADQFDASRGKAFTWASLIVRHRAIDRLRQLVRQNPNKHRQQLEQESEKISNSAPDERAELKDRHQATHRMLRSLPEDQQVVLGLAFFQGMSHGEISMRLQQPLGTVKSVIRRSLLRLRDRYQDSPEDLP
ncbi:MAG: RNA polymerase sigma factor [Verrucomicrobiales bacterium]